VSPPRISAWKVANARSIVLPRWPSHAATLTADGATAAGSPAEAVTGAGILITMLADGPATEQLCSGPAGFAAAGPGIIWVQMATVGMQWTARLAGAAAAHEMVFVDAPVSGSEGPARAGQLTILASGPDWLPDSADPARTRSLVEAIAAAERQIGGTPARLFHLAIPPTAFEPTVTMLGAAGLARGSRVIIEKPFGTDLASARALNATVHAHFSESQVFRIDHFPGKESVGNILAFRFANGPFEPA
jgi:hypothetical protein